MNHRRQGTQGRALLCMLALAAAAFGLVACTAPTPATSPAAPSAAPDLADAVVGIYKSILPGASSPGIDGTLYLNEDGTLRQIDDYLNEMPPLVEVGTWAADEDGTVTLSVTGQEGRPYDQPVLHTLQFEGGVLTAVADPDKPQALRRAWYDFAALATGELEMPADVQAAAKRMENNLAENYRAFLPSAGCCGRDVTLSLQIDGIAVLKTDYLNGEPPIEEVGTWETTGPDSLRVTLNSQQDRVYEEPVIADYVVEEGALRGEGDVILRPVYGYAMYVISQHTGETATFVDVNGEALTEDRLSNAPYDLPDLGPFQLKAGRYEHQYGSGATEVNRAFFQMAAFGDLDGDGVGDAAAVIATETGGSGSFYYLVAMLNREGEPEQAGQALLGDRVQVEQIVVQEGTIAVTMKVAGPDDPLCCPSQEITQTYRLQEGRLEMIEGQALTTTGTD